MKKLVIILFAFLCFTNSIFSQTGCVDVLNINTGYNQSTNALYPTGSFDNYWTTVSGPFASGACAATIPSQASVINPIVGWSPNYPAANWISFRPTPNLSCNNTCFLGMEPVVFQRKFCSKADDTLIINAKMRFDNSACLYIDNIAIPLNPETIGGVPVTFSSVPYVNCQEGCYNWDDTRTFNGNYDTRVKAFKIWRSAGMHTFEIRVRNTSGGSFGAMLEGTISSNTIANNFNCNGVAACTPPASGGIAIKKVLDTNCNGKQDTGESLAPGWTFTVTGSGGPYTVTTDATGYAFLTGLNNGTYTITESAQNGWTATTPTQTATVTSSQTPILTFYNCPKPCISVSTLIATCGPIVAGVQKYNITGTISNGNNATVNTSVTSSTGVPTGFAPTTLLPYETKPFSFVYTKSGASNTACFIIKLTGPNGINCLRDTCIQLPQCPIPPCIDITQTKIECGKINAAGQQTYIISGLISNGNAAALPVIVTSTSGTIGTFSPNPVAAGATNVPFSFTYTPTSINNNPCFVVQYMTDNGTVLCKKDFCLPLPLCGCLDLTYTLKCNPSVTPNTPQPYVYMVMISNPTTSTINIPMTSSTGLISPSSINAAPGTNTYNVYYTPNAGTTKACIAFGTGIVPLPIPLCKTPPQCVDLPNCCLDADGKLSCDSIVNGIRTYKFTGSVTNYGSTTALVSGLGITSNVAGAISAFVPASGVPANSSALISFIFTPTGIMPPNICFYFAPSKTSKACDSVCVQTPDCPPVVSKPCIDITKLDAKCEKINGVNTIILTGMLNTSTGVVTNLNINPLSAGTISGITGGSIPANATGHNFSFQFVPSAFATTYCFVFSPTHPVIDFKLCKDTFCIKNPCPPVVNDCCPKTSIKPCVCTDSPSFITYNFTSVISAPVCKVEISTAPAVSFLPSNVTVNMVNDGAFVANVHNFTSGGVTGNVSFSAAVIIGTSTTFTVTYTLCNGTVCKESFNVKPKTVGDVVLVDNVVLTDTMFAYPIKFRTNNGQSNERVKFISVLLESNSKNKDLLFAINGTAHFGDKNNSIVPLWEAIQGSRSATFELANEVALKDMNNGIKINLVTLGRVTGIRYTLYDAEGALLYEGKVAKLTPTTILSAKETNGSIKINVAPNPASSEAKVSYSTSTDQIIKVDLLDLSGRLVKTIDQGSRTANELQTVDFNVSDIENGLYFIRFRNEKGESFVEKLSVIH